MPDSSSAADLRAVVAHNQALDTAWPDVRDVMTPDDVTGRRGVYRAESVAHATLPPAFLQLLVERHPKIGPATDGDRPLWLYLPEAAPGTDNLVMRVALKSKKYFDTYRKEWETAPDRIATPDPLLVRPSSRMWAALTRTYGFHWPCLLTSWTDGEWVYVRRTFTEEVWQSVDGRLRRYILANQELFGLP